MKNDKHKIDQMAPFIHVSLCKNKRKSNEKEKSMYIKPINWIF